MSPISDSAAMIVAADFRVRTDELFREERATVFRRTDRMFAVLMVVQWLATVVAAYWITPHAWSGTGVELHMHVKLAVVLGGLLTGLPVFLAFRFPGHVVSRNVICMAQVIFSGLLIHVTGGRIETHFHVFGSLAFISIYQDWKVLVPATIIVAADHIARGWLWPQSIYGVAVVQPWLWVEHAAWVAFEVVFLLISCHYSVREMWKTATRQAQLESNNRSVEKKIEERTRELQVAAEAAMAASTAKSQFLANMSHEIRTPMNGMIGLTDLLLSTKLEPDQRRQLELVQSSADSLMVVLNDILDFSKIEAGKLHLDPVAFELRDVIGDTMKLFGLRAHEKGLELSFRVRPVVPDCLVGDSGRLRQILVNLVGNALKFTGEGEVFVSVDLGERHADGKVELVFEVEDTGLGISEDKQATIFEAFTQADGSMTRKFGGTGLGLAISLRLVELMGGSLSVKSIVGRGSVFKFSALLEEAQNFKPSQRSHADVSFDGVRVLIVDDHATNRMILREMTTNWRMKPTVVDDGHAALAELKAAKVEGRPFSLVLLDAHMPEIDGFEVAERIRNELDMAAVTLMMLSSDDGTDSVERCRRLELSAHLVKPIKQSELFDSIVSVIDWPKLFVDSVKEKPAGDAKNLRNLNVLLAEDNIVNQQLMIRILQRDGHQVAVANNGREAVNLSGETDFDVILMDVQMPDLDGFQATKAIRDRGDNGGSVPIVALTAHAMKGDRDRCLQAGMDSYVAKPVQVDKLREVFVDLLPHCVTELTEPGVDAGVADVMSNAAQKRDFSPLKEEHQPRLDREELFKRFGGDDVFLMMIIDVFQTDCAEQLARVRAALEAGEFEVLERAAHALKGAAASIGGKQAAAAACVVEQFGRPSGQGHKDWLENARLAVDKLAVELDLLVEELQELALEQSQAV